MSFYDQRQIGLIISGATMRAINRYRLERGGKITKAEAVRNLLDLGLRVAGFEVEEDQ